MKHSLRFLVLSALWFSCATGLPAEEKPRLNVVFILADDLGWADVGCFGQTKIPTPNIDRIAKEGMRFTQHYSGAPVCAPSRCVLMTGKHLGHAEIRNNQQAKVRMPEFPEGQHPISDGAYTIAEAFHAVGYATGATGKWGLGPVGSTGEPNKQGFDLFFGYNSQSVAHSYYPEYLWRNRDQVKVNEHWIPGHVPAVKETPKMEDYIGDKYTPRLMEEEAVKFIDAHKTSPFFLYLPFIEPHVALHPPKETVEKFPEDWDVGSPYLGEGRYLPHPRPRAAYAAMISELDRHVGKVLDALDANGLSDHTLVVFTSDNGAVGKGPKESKFHVGGADPIFFNSTADLKGYKGSVYEGGIRVPMIVRLPGKIKAGTTSDFPSYFADWFPTLCDAVRMKKPAGLDGESLWPIMTGAKAPQTRKPLVWVFASGGGEIAVRMGDCKVVRMECKNPERKWEVYDLKADRGETKDLAAAHPELIDRAIELLKREVSENELFPVVVPPR
ncbi:MAG: arylsulfatase [Planctomycetales bacterium]